MSRAPVVIVALSCKAAYLDRYAEPDKGWTDRDETRWPAPYWDIDTGMAALLVLLTAVDEGLGACFFGVPPERIDRRSGRSSAFRTTTTRSARSRSATRREERRSGVGAHPPAADGGRRGAPRPLVIDRPDRDDVTPGTRRRSW